MNLFFVDRRRRTVLVLGVLTLVLLGVMLIGLAAGAAGGGWQALMHALLRREGLLSDIIWGLRLPRVLLAALLGAILSQGGMVFQALLRNPLAEPYILGVSGGSAIGAIIGILLGLGRFPGVWLMAFIGSLATLLLIFTLTPRQSFARGNTLLLAGVIVNAFCAAVIMFLISMAQDHRLHDIIFWMMGDFSGADLEKVLILGATALPCMGLVLAYAHRLNLLTLGAEMAQSMGVNIKHTTILLLVAVSLMVSATVSYCGLVGFVGLTMPHLLRLALGPDHRLLAPAALLGGGAFMVACDILARTLPAQGEIPVGVITALIGAPLFIYLLRKSLR